jgi:hypothetical protein
MSSKTSYKNALLGIKPVVSTPVEVEEVEEMVFRISANESFDFKLYDIPRWMLEEIWDEADSECCAGFGVPIKSTSTYGWDQSNDWMLDCDVEVRFRLVPPSSVKKGGKSTKRR